MAKREKVASCEGTRYGSSSHSSFAPGTSRQICSSIQAANGLGQFSFIVVADFTLTTINRVDVCKNI